MVEPFTDSEMRVYDVGESNSVRTAIRMRKSANLGLENGLERKIARTTPCVAGNLMQAHNPTSDTSKKHSSGQELQAIDPL